jgi:hypothetical protein
MIPQFPKFTKLDLNHKSVVDEFFQRFPTYSEFSFANMFVWDIAKPVMLSILNENLIIQFLDFKTKKYYLSLIGNNKIDDTIQELIHYSINNNLHPSLNTVPEHVISQVKNSRLFDIDEDRDNSDYIISVPLLASLEGSDIEGKRQKVNHFINTNKDKVVFHKLDLSDQNTIFQIRSVIENWTTPLKKLPNDIIAEFAAIEKAIMHHASIKLEAYGVSIDGKLEAFSIIEKVHDRTVIGHFEKGNRDYAGIYEFMNHSLCRHLSDEGYEYLNICQDMGDEGLKDSKMSYRPIKFHKKFSVGHRAHIYANHALAGVS